ncbi:thiopurine S-methyltransferase [Trypanosoma theileri]|uniref:Thiopurine S-methyltransferase n=1 Tax=Trypanosoma theileri TaxID=67003 RepID=A0A1X0P632_9TRYP|nr:thiopurine S-methyltransferase [Trypanosoma theileri]ORC92291.1 thiopurine S-methyltransferase [Trypanosoma theileri]
MRLGTHNVAEFWTEAWMTNNTGWKMGERCGPFTRNLYGYLQAAGLVAAEKQGENESVEEASKRHEAVRSFLAKKTVMVPLCGDSAVLSYMVDCGVRHVIGADLNDHALNLQREKNFKNACFRTRTLDRVAGVAEKVVVHEATDGESRITLFHGDIIKLPCFDDYKNLKVDFMYDRAAMMAIPPDLHKAYVQAVTKVLTPTAGVAYERMLRLIPEERTWGPPFMVDMEEVLQMYKEATGREYASVLILEDSLDDTRRPEWYAILPKE